MRFYYDYEERRKIMQCIQRLNTREGKALEAAQVQSGAHRLPRVEVRRELRAWFRQRWEYLVQEHERVTVTVKPDQQQEEHEHG